MTQTALFDRAFKLRKTGLWKQIGDKQIIAIRLSCGDTVYLRILAGDDGAVSINIYLGEEGLNTYFDLMRFNEENASVFRRYEATFSQKCLQIMYQNKSGLLPEDLEAARSAAKELGVRLAGNGAFPVFLKLGRFSIDSLTDLADEAVICEAMDVALLLSDEMKHHKPAELGIMPVLPSSKLIAAFSAEGGKLVRHGLIPLARYVPKTYEAISYNNEVEAASFRRLTKKGVWEAEAVMTTGQNEDGEDIIGLFIMIADRGSDKVLFSDTVLLNSDGYDAVSSLIRRFKSEKTRPNEILCRDDRTYAYLKDLCDISGTKLSVTGAALPALDAIQEEMWQDLEQDFDDTDEEAYENADQAFRLGLHLLAMDDEELRGIPRELLEEIKTMLDDNVFPYEFTKALKPRFKNL